MAEADVEDLDLVLLHALPDDRLACASPSLPADAASNGAIAALVVAGMAIGLVVPNHIRNAILAARERRAAGGCVPHAI